MTDAPDGWDERAARAPGGHVLQSSAWARVREAQGWRATFLDGPGAAQALVLWRALPFGQRFAYVPRGPVARDRAALEAGLAAAAQLARSEGALFLKVDPELPADEAVPVLRAHGFRRAADVQPVVATLVLDLAPDEDALLAALEKDTRWSVRQAAKRGVTLRDGASDADLRTFYELYAVTGGRAHFITRTWDYYRLVWRTLIDAGLARLRLAEHEGQAVAGGMTWHCGDRELYMYGATNEAGRRCYAAYGLVWSFITDARAAGYARFDLGGIPADLDDPNDTMRGPYHFKKGFGGTVVRWAGAHDAVPRELPYRAYTAAEPLYGRTLRLLRRFR